MIEINIYKFQCCCGTGFFSPHWTTHIEAELHAIEANGARGRSYVMSFANESPAALSDQAKRVAKKVTLYSEGSLTEFIAEYERAFPVHSYDFCSKNCSDAVYFMLDHFFGDTAAFRQTECCYNTYKLLCCMPCVLSCGLIPCFPVPPSFNSPRDVFDKAVMLEKTFKRAPAIRAAGRGGDELERKALLGADSGNDSGNDSESGGAYGMPKGETHLFEMEEIKFDSGARGDGPRRRV